MKKGSLIIKGLFISLLIISLVIMPGDDRFVKWFTATALGFALITFAMDVYDYKKGIH